MGSWGGTFTHIFNKVSICTHTGSSVMEMSVRVRSPRSVDMGKPIVSVNPPPSTDQDSLGPYPPPKGQRSLTLPPNTEPPPALPPFSCKYFSFP